MLSIHSCVCWQSVYLLWRNVYLGPLPIFGLGCLFFWYWAAWAACKFWRLIQNILLYHPQALPGEISENLIYLLFSLSNSRHMHGCSWCLLPGSSTLRQTAGPPWWKIPTSIIHLDLSNSLLPIICQRYSFTIVRTHHKMYLFALPCGYTNLFFWDCVFIRGEVIVCSQGVWRCNENVLNLWSLFLFALSVLCLFQIFPKGTLSSSKIFLI